MTWMDFVLPMMIACLVVGPYVFSLAYFVITLHEMGDDDRG